MVSLSLHDIVSCEVAHRQIRGTSRHSPPEFQVMTMRLEDGHGARHEVHLFTPEHGLDIFDYSAEGGRRALLSVPSAEEAAFCGERMLSPAEDELVELKEKLHSLIGALGEASVGGGSNTLRRMLNAYDILQHLAPESE